LILDTGGWLLALAGEAGYAEALDASRPAIVPGLVLAEVDWHLRRQRPAMKRLMQELKLGSYQYHPPTSDDLDRAMAIDAKFGDLGLVDASIVALAERIDVRRILTTDSDFVRVRLGRHWRHAMELVVGP
jgi:predicted nucleic acid-binding protein